jgi:hypothetical protein
MTDRFTPRSLLYAGAAVTTSTTWPALAQERREVTA